MHMDSVGQRSENLANDCSDRLSCTPFTTEVQGLDIFGWKPIHTSGQKLNKNVITSQCLSSAHLEL